jgi:hypothetical protein
VVVSLVYILVGGILILHYYCKGRHRPKGKMVPDSPGNAFEGGNMTVVIGPRTGLGFRQRHTRAVVPISSIIWTPLSTVNPTRPLNDRLLTVAISNDASCRYEFRFSAIE